MSYTGISKRVTSEGSHLAVSSTAPESTYNTEFHLVSEENFPKNLRLVDTISAIAKKKNVTASQLTLAWLLAQGDDIFPVRDCLCFSLDPSTQSLTITFRFQEQRTLLVWKRI